MSLAQPIARVVSCLVTSGYYTLEQPITIGGIPFGFAATLARPNSLDLIAVIDTVTEADDDRVRGKIEGLARALDLVKSRRTLTVILVGPPRTLTLMNALGRMSRVLSVATPTGGDAEHQLEDTLAVLLPLELTTALDGSVATWASVREELLATHPGADTAALFDASVLGANQVRDALREQFTAFFQNDQP
jgi:hypothetical protein